MNRLEGKRIVITGGNSGIGFQILSILMNRPGNEILVADLRLDAVENISENVHTLQIDVSKKENIDGLFEHADKVLGGIDVFFANAGIPYYEEISTPDWDRIDRIYRTNVVSPIYAYERYVQYLNGNRGVFAITGSAMGFFGMPGFALYSSTKFAITGFQDSIKFERPKNIQITTIFPVSTDTGFFKAASDRQFKKPFPVQTPEHVAKRFVKGIEKERKEVYPSTLFRVSMFFFRIIPPIKWGYMHFQKKEFDRYRK